MEEDTDPVVDVREEEVIPALPNPVTSEQIDEVVQPSGVIKHMMPEVKLRTVTMSEVGKEIRDSQHTIERTVPDKSPKPKSTKPAKKLSLMTSLWKLLLMFAADLLKQCQHGSVR